MSDALAADAPPADRREQPFLYTWNRKLRHLHGLSLRNLNLSSSAPRSRGKTIADDDYELKTAATSLIRREARTLQHAKSYDQLSKAHESPLESPPRASTHSQKGKGSPLRPPRANMRRRSTLHWATSDPRSRQLKLEAVEANRLIDSWFSLHHAKIQQPIYISEVMNASMNPTFSFFDLDSSLAGIARSDDFILRVWAKSQTMREYRILVEIRVNLRSLQFVGRSLENFHHPLPENCILFHLSDGIYTSFTDLPMDSPHQPGQTLAMRAMAPTQTASFDALLKLADLDEVIQDALQTRAKLEADINVLLSDMSSTDRALSRLASRRESLRATKALQEAEKKSLDALQKSKTEKQNMIQARRKLLATLPQTQHAATATYRRCEQESSSFKKQIVTMEDKSGGQVRRICTSLLHVFPIEPIKNKTLQFTIRNVHLPNSAFSDTNRDEIAAALGFTAQILLKLSLYLSVPLPYAIEVDDPIVHIRDNISAGIAQRQFPLHPASPVYKFEYAVFLLNKDVEFLMNRHGLRTVDIRHTLPNLKYLLFVLTAGSGEMPDRKAGGVRGLLRGRLTPNVSRRNSDESVLSQASTTVFDSKEKMGDVDDTTATSVRARGLRYRKSMLHDAG